MTVLRSQVDTETQLHEVRTFPLRTKMRVITLPVRLSYLDSQWFEEITDGTFPGFGVEFLADFYHFSNYDDVAAFIRLHPSLIPLLFEAWENIKYIFGNDVPIRLSLFEDPEAREHHALLITILASLNLDRREALFLLDKLDETWWLDTVQGAHGMLILNME